MNFADMYDEIRSLAQEQNWAGIDQWLLVKSVGVIDKPDEVVTLIALLTLCLPFKSKLYHYASLRHNAAYLLGDRAERVLKGL